MDPILVIALLVVLVAVLVGLLYVRSHILNAPAAVRRRPVPVNADDGGARRPVRNRIARNRMRANRDEEEEEEREQHVREVLEENDMEMPAGKIGTKKLRKLEEKAEKRRMRELELQEREERKQKEAEEEERRKKEEFKREQEEKRQEELEKKAKEEKERKEHEEYLKMKAAFNVEDEGFDQDDDDNSTKKLAEFIEYIKEQKVVQLEDLAAHFKLKTQDCINRVQDLLEAETICGVIDDRGKFISITKEELEEVAKFIKVRGRVSIQELVENSNRLINLAVSA